MPFFCIHNSQESVAVATCLKHGGIFKHKFVANLLPNRLVKNFENRVIVSEVMVKSLVCCFFLTNGVSKVLRPTRHKIGNFGDVLPANLLAWY